MCQGFKTEFFFGLGGGGLREGRSADETFGSAL